MGLTGLRDSHVRVLAHIKVLPPRVYLSENTHFESRHYCRKSYQNEQETQLGRGAHFLSIGKRKQQLRTKLGYSFKLNLLIFSSEAQNMDSFVFFP